jgi:hypothetical protein
MSSPSKIWQSITLEPRRAYDFSFWFALHSVGQSSNGGCNFDLIVPSQGTVGTYHFPFAETPPVLDNYYQAWITFESQDSAVDLMLSMYCHGDNDQDFLSSYLLIDELSLRKSDLVCGARGTSEAGADDTIETVRYESVDGYQRCIDRCSLNSQCRTISYNGEYCTLLNSNTFEMLFMYGDSANGYYDIACSDCGRSVPYPGGVGAGS